LATKKHIIEIEPEYDFSILSITATASDYAICICLDNQFNLQFKNQAPLQLKLNKVPVDFVLFGVICDVKEAELCLLNNKSKGNYFLKEFKQTDYFIRLSGDWAMAHTQQIIDCIKQIDGVQAVTKTDVELIKQKELLTFELENKEYTFKHKYEVELKNSNINTI
jgi:hypothetical protein